MKEYTIETYNTKTYELLNKEIIGEVEVRDLLLQKYNDSEMVQFILDRLYWGNQENIYDGENQKVSYIRKVGELANGIRIIK